MRKPTFEKIRAILFDAGNTLIYPDYSFIRDLLQEIDVEIEVQRLRENECLAREAAARSQSERPWKIYFGTWLTASGANEGDLPDLFQRLWDRHLKKNLWSRVEPDTPEVLAELKKQLFLLGVISNSDGRLLKQLQELDLEKYFDTIIDSEILGVRKPDPAIFLHAFEQLGIEPEQSVYVGDIYEIDILGAEKVGATGILIDPFDRHPQQDCLKIHRCKDLLKFFQNGRDDSK